MHLSKNILAVFAGTATASSFMNDLNSTELGAVLAGAGPVITETITTTEHLAVIPMRTPRYKWLNLPIRLTSVATSSAIPEEQVEPYGHHRQLLDSHGTALRPSPATTSSVMQSTLIIRIHKHISAEHRSTTLASETAFSQQTTTSDLPQATMNLRDLRTSLRHGMLLHGFGKVKEMPLTLISQPTTASELSESTKDMESRLHKKALKWMSDLKVAGGMQTTYPHWSMTTKKWHGPYSHPEATAVTSATVEQESVEAVSSPTEAVPVVTASAFRA